MSGIAEKLEEHVEVSVEMEIECHVCGTTLTKEVEEVHDLTVAEFCLELEKLGWIAKGGVQPCCQNCS